MLRRGEDQAYGKPRAGRLRDEAGPYHDPVIQIKPTGQQHQRCVNNTTKKGLLVRMRMSHVQHDA